MKKFDHMIPLLLSQQAELDGAAMYNKLAALTENGDAQRVFREIAADEAAHALPATRACAAPRGSGRGRLARVCAAISCVRVRSCTTARA